MTFEHSEIIVRCGSIEEELWDENRVEYDVLVYDIKNNLIGEGDQGYCATCPESSDWSEDDWQCFQHVMTPEEYLFRAVALLEADNTWETVEKYGCKTHWNTIGDDGYKVNRSRNLAEHYMEWYNTRKYIQCEKKHDALPKEPSPPPSPPPPPIDWDVTCLNCRHPLTPDTWVDVDGGYRMCSDKFQCYARRMENDNARR